MYSRNGLSNDTNNNKKYWSFVKSKQSRNKNKIIRVLKNYHIKFGKSDVDSGTKKGQDHGRKMKNNTEREKENIINIQTLLQTEAN